MNFQMILKDVSTLPPDKQEEVADFVAFLKSRFGTEAKGFSLKKKGIKSESFVGMWRDRDEMVDSSAWVQNLRSQEWEPRNSK